MSEFIKVANVADIPDPGKKLLELDKVGHGGTPDPKVTGVLPVTLQDSTKIVQA